MTEKKLQKFIEDITREKEIIKAGRDMLEDIKKNSIVDYVTDGADKKFFDELGRPQYEDVAKSFYSKYYEAQDKEKSLLDSYRSQIAQFKQFGFYSQTNLGDMDHLIRDIISYSIKKGYQGTAAMYLRDCAKSVGALFDRATPPKDEFIRQALNGIIGGYARRTLLTGYWYGDRALQTIYAAQNGDFGIHAKSVPVSELLEVFNTASADEETMPEITINDLCSQYRNLPYKPLTKAMYDGEVAEIKKQHRVTREL